MPGTRAITSLNLVGGLLQHIQIIAEQLDGILAFHAGRGLLDIIFDILGES